jgi:AraC-like DNA-binding protein
MAIATSGWIPTITVRAPRSLVVSARLRSPCRLSATHSCAGGTFNEPARPWSPPHLAGLCNRRATFVRHSQEKMGPSANDLMTAIRMAMTANEIRNSSSSTGSIAKSVGYQSEAGFQRALSSI